MHTINIQRKSINTINSYPTNASTFFLILAFRIKKTTPMKHNEQMEADRKEAAPERVEAEIVYAPVVAETHEYQYNADAFEARGAADMKVEIGKEVSKVREDKAR